MTDILIVDDHTIFRSGLKRLLGDEADLRVVAEAGDGAEALRLLRARPVDLVILDINLGGRSGLEVLGAIRRQSPALPVLIMSMYPEAQFAAAAFRDGANGYVSKDATPALLFDAIRRIVAGRPGPHDARVPAGIRNGDAGPPHYRLSAREMQIFNLIVAGTPLTEIGERMFLSVKTVSTYRSRVLEKLGLRNNAELVQYAVRHGVGTV